MMTRIVAGIAVPATAQGLMQFHCLDWLRHMKVEVATALEAVEWLWTVSSEALGAFQCEFPHLCQVQDRLT